MDTFDSGATHQVDSVAETIKFVEHHAADSRLNYELSAFHAWGCRNVERGVLGGVVASRYFCDGVCLGMEHVGLCHAGFVLADILESGGGAVISVGYDHLILNNDSSDLPTAAVGVFGPDAGHAEISLVEGEKLLFVEVPFGCHVIAEG